MRNIIILSVFLLILSICAFLVSCDDFFSPNIEIFNEVKTPTTIEQDHRQNQNQEQKKKKEQKNSTDTIVINNQEYLVN